jgi:hypothetical protein
MTKDWLRIFNKLEIWDGFLEEKSKSSLENLKKINDYP